MEPGHNYTRTPPFISYQWGPLGEADAVAADGSPQVTSHDFSSPFAWRDLMRGADESGVAFVILNDGSPCSLDPLQWEPGVLAAFLATQTRRVGLLVPAAPAVFEPFNLARLVASTDYVSHGRAGWYVQDTVPDVAAQRHVTGPGAQGLGGAAHLAEYVGVIRKLWDSWEDDAFVRDKATGTFVRPEKIHAVAHRGEAFRVDGALNVARPPQGQPPIVMHWTPGVDLRALEIDVAIISPNDVAHAVMLCALIHQKNPDWEGLVFADVHFNLKDTDGDTNASSRPSLGLYLEGTGVPLAAALLHLARESGIDGLNLRPVGGAAQLQRASHDLLPAMRAAHASEPYAANATLRERLGLQRPRNRLADPSV